MSAPNCLVVMIIGIGVDALAHPRVATGPDPQVGDVAFGQVPAGVTPGLKKARTRIVCGVMRYWPVNRASSVAVATTSGRHGGRYWKSETRLSASSGQARGWLTSSEMDSAVTTSTDVDSGDVIAFRVQSVSTRSRIPAMADRR